MFNTALRSVNFSKTTIVVDHHPQMDFTQATPSAKEGIISKPGMSNGRPKEKVTRQEINTAKILNEEAWNLRYASGTDGQSIEPANQWLSASPDAKYPVLNGFHEVLVRKELKEGANSLDYRVTFRATAYTGVATCGPMAIHLLMKGIQRLRSQGLTTPLYVREDKDSHVFLMSGDPNSGSVFRHNPWTVIPETQKMTLQEIADSHTIISSTNQPSSFVEAPDNLSGKITETKLNKFAQENFGASIGPAMFEKLIEFNIAKVNEEDGAKKGSTWNRVHGPGDPRTVYISEESDLPVTFDRVHADFWKSKVRDPQDQLDQRDQKKLMAAGYDRNGSDGR